MVSYVVSGVILTAIGIYEPIVKFAGAGATVPLTGFGYSLAKGVEKAVNEYGLVGALSGGLTATAAGIATAIGLLPSIASLPKVGTIIASELVIDIPKKPLSDAILA